MVEASGQGLNALLCMKANEVMKEDLLLDPQGDIVTVLSAGETSNMRQPFIKVEHKDGTLETFMPEELHPVPITDELIRKSNIVAHCTGEGCVFEDGHYVLYVNGDRVDIRRITPTDWRLSVFKDLPLSNYDCYFQNFHQMQHAMTDQGVLMQIKMMI
jgi:hypothetical protein